MRDEKKTVVAISHFIFFPLSTHIPSNKTTIPIQAREYLINSTDTLSRYTSFPYTRVLKRVALIYLVFVCPTIH